MRAFYTHKKHQKAQKALKIQKHKQTHKNANNQTKIKNALKKYLSGKRSLICIKSLYNGNVDPTKLVKVFSALYEQK